MFQSKIPQKLKDSGSFTIPCSIGTRYNGRALCDLGASINLMPLSVFKSLGVRECKTTTVTLQLADRSHVYPEGKIEDVLVKVDKFISLVDFIVLDFEADKEEFDLEIKDRKGIENQVADHLSRLEADTSTLTKKDITETFPDEQLLVKKKFLHDVRSYQWDDPYLYKLCSDQVIRRCASDEEIPHILEYYHAAAYGGHFGGHRTAAKVLQLGYYWPSIFKDADEFAKYCNSFGTPRAIINDEGTHFYNKVFAVAMVKYGVRYKVAIAYHLQSNGQVEDSLWAYRIAYKTPLGMSPYRIVYGKACHLPFELEHKAYWALKQLNWDIHAAAEQRKLQLCELDEFPKRGWLEFCNHPRDPVLPVVKEFYANLVSSSQHNIWVRNSLGLLDSRVINAFYNLPTEINYEYAQLLDKLTSQRWNKIFTTLIVEGASWANEEGRVINKIDLKPIAKVWVKFLKSRLIPTAHTTTVSQERLVLLYVIVIGFSIDVGSIIKKEIRDCAMKNHKAAALLFPSLITSICVVSGVRLDAKDEHVKNDCALTVRTIKRITGEVVGATSEPAAVTGQYNFDTNTTEAPTEVSEETTDTYEPEEESATEPQAEAELETADQSDQPEEESDKSATDSSPIEAKEESEKEREEPPVRTSSKSRKKHIIQEEKEDEPAEEPLILVLSKKGKEKVTTRPASNDEAEQIDAELEAAATRVTRTPTETKQLFDIIAAITAEGHAADAPAPAPPQQTLSNTIRASPRETSKRNGGTSGSVAAAASPEPKRTRSVSAKQDTPTATPPASLLQKKKKTLPATSPQESRKDKLRSASKKR
ncbi:hypothetical protein KPL70_001079 [Citrus sinensis]|nr:hypothetical protein KPL70_001079 [Citrus sinensis]